MASTEHPYPIHTASIDLRALWHVFRRHWLKVALFPLLAVGAVATCLHYTRPVYASRAVLEVAQDRRAELSDADSPDLLKTMELKIASQPVLLAVIAANHLQDDPEFMAEPAPSVLGRLKSALGSSWVRATGGAPGSPARLSSGSVSTDYAENLLLRKLDAKISVNLVRGSRLIGVTAEDFDPVKAQRLAQSVLDQFFRRSWDEQHKDLSSARQLLLTEAARAAAETSAAESRLQAYREAHHSVSLSDQQNIVVERLRQLNQQVAGAENTRVALQTDRDLIRQLAAADPQKLLSLRSVATVPEVVDLRRAVALQEAQLGTLAKRYGPQHPTMIQASGQLEELRASLNEAIRKAGNLVLQSYASAQATAATLATSLAEQERAALELDRLAIPYHVLEREVQADAVSYQQVLTRLEQSDVTHGLLSTSEVDGNSVRVVERPLIPIRPIRPVARWWLALALVGGLALGCGSALTAHALDNTVSSVDGAETFLGLPVLVTIPRSRVGRLENGPAVIEHPASVEAECFRSLCTVLSLGAPVEDRRLVLFVSAVPGEGKSSCSMNYAAALAQQGSRTLIIDADLRRPRLQEALVPASGLKLGLSDCLRQPDLFTQALKPTAVPNLSFLGDARGKPGSAALLAQDTFPELLRRALAEFDRVVIDSAPLVAVSDTLRIAKDVPVICLVVHAGKTPRRLVQRACLLLQQVAGRAPIGVVLNKIPHNQSAHYDYYSSNEAYS